MRCSSLQKLQTEHDRCRTLLAVLEQQCRGIRRCDSPDFHLMADILASLAHQFHSYHEPLERAMLDALAERAPADVLQEVDPAHEHDDIARRTRVFSQLLDEVLGGLMVYRSQLVETGLGYVNSYRNHLAAEEQTLFPLLDRYLDENACIQAVTRACWQGPDDVMALLDDKYRLLNDRVRSTVGRSPDQLTRDDSCPACAAG